MVIVLCEFIACHNLRAITLWMYFIVMYDKWFWIVTELNFTNKCKNTFLNNVSDEELMYTVLVEHIIIDVNKSLLTITRMIKSDRVCMPNLPISFRASIH